MTLTSAALQDGAMLQSINQRGGADFQEVPPVPWVPADPNVRGQSSASSRLAPRVQQVAESPAQHGGGQMNMIDL